MYTLNVNGTNYSVRQIVAMTPPSPVASPPPPPSPSQLPQLRRQTRQGQLGNE
jgi:hypothetical protein